MRADYGTTIVLLRTTWKKRQPMLRVAIMHLGKLAVIGTPTDLKASLNKENVTLDDVFVYYTGGGLDKGESYRETTMTRRTARRLG